MGTPFALLVFIGFSERFAPNTKTGRWKMAFSMHIIFGIMLGGLGLVRMADDPGSGICALLLAGVLILRGIDQLGHVDEQPVSELHEGKRSG